MTIAAMMLLSVMGLSACTGLKKEAKAEKEAGERPAIKGKVENMSLYDVVFVCVPV